MSELRAILESLIAKKSVTPDDAACQDFMIAYLKQLGFSCHRFDKEPVSNFFAIYGDTGPILLFAGHTDVVSAGDLNHWHSDPFILTERNGFYYGRGVADMKGSLAAMLSMANRFVKENPQCPGRLAFLITSAEEGDHFDLGTPYAMQALQQMDLIPNYCIVGEPSASEILGDVIKVGRRGSLSAAVHLRGKQGHVAYPHLADNPIHAVSPLLAELVSIRWDEGDDLFDPSTLQITEIKSGGLGGNVIPPDLFFTFNLRFSTQQRVEAIKERIQALFDDRQLKAELSWRLNGQPFLTQAGRLLEATEAAILEHTGLKTESSTSGGTSDARFIAPFGVEVLELGPVNRSIHQANECVLASSLDRLDHIYYSIAAQLLLI